MPDFNTIDSRCLDSWHILISGQFKHRYLLNISCSKIFDSCKIKRMVTYLTQLGYVNQRTNGPVNAHLISWPSKAQNIQNLEKNMVKK